MEEDIKIKVLEVKKIPTDKIQISNTQVRQYQAGKGIDKLAEQIRELGLIQPIVVYQENDKYELIAGQRRFFAHRDVLKWENILAMIIEKPKNDMISMTISWLENEARQKMSNQDKIRHVANMYAEGMKIRQIAQRLGIKEKEVNGCIKLPRVPDIVRQAVEKGELEPDTAVKATDAKRFVKHETSEESGEDVLDLAKKMQTARLTPTQMTNMVSYGEENDGIGNDIMIVEGVKRETEIIKIDLQSSDVKRLENYAENNSQTKNIAAASLVLDGLNQAGD